MIPLGASPVKQYRKENRFVLQGRGHGTEKTPEVHYFSMLYLGETGTSWGGKGHLVQA